MNTHKKREERERAINKIISTLSINIIKNYKLILFIFCSSRSRTTSAKLKERGRIFI